MGAPDQNRFPPGNPRQRRWVANITIYPSETREHSSNEDLSALAGYAKALLRNMDPVARRRSVVLTNLKGEARKTYIEDDLEIRECWRKGRLSYAWQLWRELIAHPEWRVVHLQHEFNEFGGALTLPLNLLTLAALRFLARRRIAVTLHEVLSLERIRGDFLRQASVPFPAILVRLVVRIYYTLLSRLAHTIVVQDEHFAEILREDYHAPDRFTLVQLGTEEMKAPGRQDSRRALQLAATSPVLLYFGALDWYKGLDLLIDGFSLLPPGCATLLVAGGQPVRSRHTLTYRDWWRRLQERIDRCRGIRLLGFVEDGLLPYLFGASDLVVLPHVVPQRVSLVFNQAASYGVPLVASRAFEAQAHPDMLFDATPDALAAKILWALDGHLEALRAHSLEFRAQNLWSRSADAMARLHEALADARGH